MKIVNGNKIYIQYKDFLYFDYNDETMPEYIKKLGIKISSILNGNNCDEFIEVEDSHEYLKVFKFLLNYMEYYDKNVFEILNDFSNNRVFFVDDPLHYNYIRDLSLLYNHKTGINNLYFPKEVLKGSVIRNIGDYVFYEMLDSKSIVIMSERFDISLKDIPESYVINAHEILKSKLILETKAHESNIIYDFYYDEVEDAIVCTADIAEFKLSKGK